MVGVVNKSDKKAEGNATVCYSQFDTPWPNSEHIITFCTTNGKGNK